MLWPLSLTITLAMIAPAESPSDRSIEHPRFTPLQVEVQILVRQEGVTVQKQHSAADVDAVLKEITAATATAGDV